MFAGSKEIYKKTVTDSNKIFNNSVDKRIRMQVYDKLQSSQLKYYACVMDFSLYCLGARVN